MEVGEAYVGEAYHADTCQHLANEFGDRREVEDVVSEAYHEDDEQSDEQELILLQLAELEDHVGEHDGDEDV